MSGVYSDTRYNLLHRNMEMVRSNNDVVSSIFDGLMIVAKKGVANLVVSDEYTISGYRKHRQTVLDTLGYFGYEVVERKDTKGGNIIDLIVKPKREVVSGRVVER